MSINPKFIQLLGALNAATAVDRLDWSETFGEDTYRVSLDNAAVRIGLDEGVYTATLFDDSAEPVEEVKSNDCGEFECGVLKSLYETVEQQRARKRDALLDRLISNVSGRKSLR